MLVETTSLLLAGLNQHIHAADGSPLGSADIAILGNPSQLDNQDVGPTLENQLLLTVLNLEEEATLKNGPAHFRENGGVTVRHRPVHLNLFLIFSASYANYHTALQRLGQVVTYFQSHRHFEPSGYPGVLPNLPLGTELSVTMELVSLSLEEINHIWGALGGRALPFAAYRARLIVLSEDRPAAGGGDIREVGLLLRDKVMASEAG